MLDLALILAASHPWAPALVLVIAAAAAAGVAFGRAWGARGLARSLCELDDALEGLARGEPARVARLESPAVVARLAERLNQMAEAVDERERVIGQLAVSDPETGLPDRRALEAELAALVAADETGVAAVAVSIDRFAELRAAIGQAAALAVLTDVAGRLAAKAPAAMVGRLAPDTLGMVVGSGGASAAQAAVAGLEGPAAAGEATAEVSLTTGVAPAAAAVDAEGSPLVLAAIAVEHARATRRKLAVFTGAALGEPAANLALIGQMRSAIEAGQIDIHLQPKYDIRQGRTAAVEALVRWTHPTRGLLSPGVFVRLAEATGHIRLLTDHVLARAIADQAALRAAGHALEVSVNVTGRLLADAGFVEHVLVSAAAAEGRLCLEVTAAGLAEDPDRTRRHVEQLAQAGVGVSIDDYGAGALPLISLREIRAEEVKIDKSLILDLADARKNALLVRSAITLAHDVGMKVTAKGVETNEAYALLASMGCDFAQGFLVERPMPLPQLLAFLEEDRTAVRFG